MACVLQRPQQKHGRGTAFIVRNGDREGARFAYAERTRSIATPLPPTPATGQPRATVISDAAKPPDRLHSKLSTLRDGRRITKRLRFVLPSHLVRVVCFPAVEHEQGEWNSRLLDTCTCRRPGCSKIHRDPTADYAASLCTRRKRLCPNVHNV